MKESPEERKNQAAKEIQAICDKYDVTLVQQIMVVPKEEVAKQ